MKPTPAPKAEPAGRNSSPAHPVGPLSRACEGALQHVRTLSRGYQEKNYLGFLFYETLNGLDQALAHLPVIAQDYAVILETLKRAQGAELTEEEATQIRRAYDNAVDTSFPTTRAYLSLCHQFHGLSQDHSLSSIALPRLRQLEVDSLGDSELRKIIKDLHAAFGRVKNLDDGQGFRQAYEHYGEALVYSLLNAKFPTQRLEATGNPRPSMPDFACTLPNGKSFYVELKSLDIVDGEQRPAQMRASSMDKEIALESQLKDGARVAFAYDVIAPFRRAHDTDDYDPSSLLTVINTFISKGRKLFKSPQFKQGPTFAVALCDRLFVPGGKRSLVPQYVELDGALISGVLWHVCFGAEGDAIKRLDDSHDATEIEGKMTGYGLLKDPAIPFPTGAVIFAETFWGEDRLLGLYDETWASTFPFWTTADTKEVMHTLCTSVNDSKNSHGHLLESAP